MIEVTTEDIVVDIVNDIDVSSTGNIDVVVEDNNELDITVAKKEFVIAGDDIYVPILYEDVPQWMKDLVSLSVNQAVEGVSTSNLDQLNSMLAEFATSYVPLNQYTQSILDLSNADVSLHAVIETLNSNYEDGINSANSQIITLQQTKASKNEVLTQVIETISAQLSDDTSDIGAIIARLDQAIVSSNQSSALSYQAVISTLESMEGEITGNAQAVQTLRTYVGVDPNGGVTGTGLLADVQILQKQNDGVINTFTGVYDVIEGVENPNNNTDNDRLLTNVEPYSLWIAQDLANGNVDTRTSHIGDVYIKYNLNGNGTKEYIASFKFVRTIPDSTSPYSTDSEGFTWAVIIDQAAQDAYVAALNAWDLADDKRRVYVGLGATTTPETPYEQGDLWLIDIDRTVNGYSAKVGDILRCIESKVVEGATYEQNDWVLASSYANAIKAEADALENWKNTTYANTITSIQTQVDKKAETFYQSSVPTGRLTLTNVVADVELDKYIGDLWKNTHVGTVGGYLGNNTEYIYSKIANGIKWDYRWIKMEVPDIVFDTIDTKKSIYSGNAIPVVTAPDEVQVNDMWITGDNPVSPYASKSVYVWNGAEWELPLKYTDDTTVNAFVSNVYEPKVASLQNQLDGKIEYYFKDIEASPNLPSQISSNWGENEHGNVVYYRDTEHAYWYNGRLKTWEAINDVSIYKALQVAEKAESAVDGVVVSFYAIKQDTAPATTSMWLNKTGTKVLKEYKTSWVNVAVQTGDTLMAYDPVTKDMSTYVYNGSGWITNTENGMVAESKAVTDLTASLNTTNGVIGGHTTQLSTVDTRIANGVASVESKWAYNSTLNLGGVTYSSGFGLATNLTDATIPVGSSEFWVNANNFKVVDPTTGKQTLISGGKVNADLIEMKSEENGYVFTIDKTGIKIVKDGVLRLLIGKIA